ncbi:MAG: hypothetical protein GF372_13635, partial [Candidatus Marinimicrobia bacterium]|nr:hypothetical protein [Candidatus Neomarinimicrobiota bacterium]
PAEGGVVILPPGRFEIDSPLRITQSDILIRGAGTATHIHNTNESGEPTLIIEADPDSGDDTEPQWRVQLSDLRITGNENSGDGIVARDVNEIFIHGVTVSYHGGDGILLDECYEDPRVSNSLITYNDGTGLNLIACHDIIVSDNQFEENNDAVRCIDGFNLCMTGNNLDDHLGNGVVIENTYGSVLAGNMIEECSGFAVILDRDCYGISLGSNVIAHNGGGIDLRDAHGCSVSSNTFTIMKSHAVRVGTHSGRINITGNNISNSYIGDGEVKRNPDDLAAAGITLESTENILLSGNLFSGLTTPAVEVVNGNSQNVLFNNNLLVDVQTEHTELQNSLMNNNMQTEN